MGILTGVVRDESLVTKIGFRELEPELLVTTV